MRTSKTAYFLSFDSPACYCICIQGQITAKWMDVLEGLTITEKSLPGGVLVTTLIGELTDQAAFVGVINSLYEMHLPILSVECLGNG